MTVLTIRPFERRDYAAVVTVSTAVYPNYPWSADEWRHEDARYDGVRLTLHRLVAEEAGGRVVGVGEYHHVSSMYHPQKLWVDLTVHPDHQGRGIGKHLYDALTDAMRPLDPVVFWGNVRETLARSLRFVYDRGFREIRRAWESRLDVMHFDPSPFAAQAGRGLEGLEVTTVTGLRARDPDWLRQLYEMHIDVSADVPQPEPYTPPTLEEYTQRMLDHPGYLPDGHFLAVDGGRYVGESFLFRSQELPDVLYQGLTATRREYRGRGVALGLKLRTIDYARRHGYREIRTWNDSLNAPMLRINVKLGFARQPAWITFEKRV